MLPKSVHTLLFIGGIAFLKGYLILQIFNSFGQPLIGVLMAAFGIMLGAQQAFSIRDCADDRKELLTKAQLPLSPAGEYFWMVSFALAEALLRPLLVAGICSFALDLTQPLYLQLTIILIGSWFTINLTNTCIALTWRMPSIDLS